MSVQASDTANPEALRASRMVRLQQAVDALDRSLGEAPAALTQDVDIAERAIAGVRDDLIRELRQAALDVDTSRCRRHLDEVNVALSLVAGVEYPTAGIQRKLLEQARDVLGGVRGRAR